VSWNPARSEGADLIGGAFGQNPARRAEAEPTRSFDTMPRTETR
jgi:hypothetical protein